VPVIPGRHFVRNLVERRALVAQLVRRDFHQRYVGSAGGWLWGVVHPLVLLGCYYFVFQVCLNQQPPKDFVGNYAVFIFTGFLPWLLFQETITRSAGSLVDHANLITRTVFPSEVVPLSIFFSSLIHHLIAAALAILFVAHLGPSLLLLPVYMFFVGLLAVGIGWIVSGLHVYLRDTGQVMMVVLTMWFYLTPILISEETLQGKRFIKYVVFWNPMTWVVRGYRELLSARWPAWHDMGIMASYSITIFIIGGLLFRVLKRGFADVL